MRYNEQVANDKQNKDNKKRELPQQGKYTSKDLEKTKAPTWRK